MTGYRESFSTCMAEDDMRRVEPGSGHSYHGHSFNPLVFTSWTVRIGPLVAWVSTPHHSHPHITNRGCA